MLRLMITLTAFYAVKALNLTCLTWEIKDNLLTLLCRGNVFEYPIVLRDPQGRVQAMCSYGVQKPCKTFNRFSSIAFDVSEQQLIFTYNRSTSFNLDGIWTCSHRTITAITTVSSSMGIYGSVSARLSGSLIKSGDKFRITLVCYSCWKTLENTIEFLTDHNTFDSFIYRDGRCYHKDGECTVETCSCSPEPISIFRLTYETTSEFLAKQYSCKALYLESITGSKLSSYVTINFTGKEFVENTITATIIKPPDEIPDTEEKQDATYVTENMIILVSIIVSAAFVILVLMVFTYRCFKYKRLQYQFIKGKTIKGKPETLQTSTRHRSAEKFINLVLMCDR